MNQNLTSPDEQKRNHELEERLVGPNWKKYSRFTFAALSSIPWVGGMIGAAAALNAETEQARANELICRWLEEHQVKINALGATIQDIIERVEGAGEDAHQRLSDDDYLSLARQGFRVWDEANAETKRNYVRRTLANAACTAICSDDLVRLFLCWIEQYDEIHFRVIRVLFRHRGATRMDIWKGLSDAQVREDSAEADLFKLLISDLSTGHVLRQIRQTNDQGEFLAKRRTGRPAASARTTLETAFDVQKPYELTKLGEQFATYVLNETVPRIR